MNADALSLETGGKLAPVLSPFTTGTRGSSVERYAPGARLSSLLGAAALARADALGGIESSPTMPKAAAQSGT
ncbi:MAG: hypothetical protein ACRD5L_16135, partial [Bryobacteraceae bacterium]